MTRAAVATAFGGPEVLDVVEVDVPEPGPGQVLVEVRAAGINPIDYKLYSGAFGNDPASLPMRLGFEASGVVLATGADPVGPAGPVSVGDEVIAYQVSGAYADRLVVPATSILPKPAALDWAAAAGLMLVGVTAVHSLTATGVGPGDTVLVHGGSGGVGQAAVQLATARGARVIATGGPSSFELLRKLGAEPVAYGDGLLDRVRALAPEGIDAAVDTVGTDEAVDTSVELVADRGRIATIAAFGRGPGLGIKLLGGGPGAEAGTEIRSAARLELLRQVDAGRLTVLVAGTYPLAEVQAAHRAAATSHAPGKLVLIP